MASVTVSSKYQIVIPKEVREALDIKPGQELAVLVKGTAISLVPVPTLEELRGVLKGADLSGLREKVDRP
ncbi:MAG: AbrB/MazE/SpoVT family DNA-binding domain-containing protein [Armatimonadota bacterium]